MSYFSNISIGDSANLDAFSRLRVSEPRTLFSDTSEYGLNTQYWETSISAGGTTSNLVNQSAIRLSLSTVTAGAYSIRQSRYYIRYQPGKSQLTAITFCMGQTATNSNIRVGYFDDNNGIFLERNGTNINIVRRTFTSGSVVDNSISITGWNIDKMNGSGPSGKTLDLTKTQILVIDLQWLGVGRVRVGFDIDGSLYYVHQFLNANSNQVMVYMQTANLPVRYEIKNIGTASASSYLDTICATVFSEGSYEEQRALQFSASNGVTAKSLSNNTPFVPIISVQAATAGPTGIVNHGQILLRAIEATVIGNTSIYYEIRLNPSLTGAVWTSANPLSIANYDTTATAILGGIVIDSGYLPSATQLKTTGLAQIYRSFPLVYTALGKTQDILTLCAVGVGGASSAVGALTWQEDY